MFVDIKKIDTQYFSTCENCKTDCCSFPKVSLAPLILEDFEYVYEKFLIQFAYINKELRVLMVINRGEGSCAYFKDSMCSIYEKRPPACRMFPISPYFSNFYIDTSCPAVNTEGKGEIISKDGDFSKSFYHHRVENFVEKLEKTKEFLNSIELGDLKPSMRVAGIQLFNYKGDRDNEYMKMYKESLAFL